MELTERFERFNEICNAVELFDPQEANEPVFIPRGVSGLTDIKLRDALLCQAFQSRTFAEVLSDGLMRSLIERYQGFQFSDRDEAQPTADEVQALAVISALNYSLDNHAEAFNSLIGMTMACRQLEIPVPRLGALILMGLSDDMPSYKLRQIVDNKTPIEILNS